MFSGPVRGGTRGGQGDFKWTDVADDKDRENYLGHSILAPVGRWQKNKDITWYNKDGGAIDDDERLRAKREEIQRIKAAEEDALSAALGFKPGPRAPMSAPETSSNAIPLGPSRSGIAKQDDRDADSENDIQRKKAEKAARKAERAAKRERKLEEKIAKKKPLKSSKHAEPEISRGFHSDRADNRSRDRHSHHRDPDSHQRDRGSHHRDRDSHYQDRHRLAHPAASNHPRDSRSPDRLPGRASSESAPSPRESPPIRIDSRHPNDRHRESDRHHESDRHREFDRHRTSKSLSHSNRRSRPLSPPVHTRHQRPASPIERQRDERRRSRSPPRRTHHDY